MNKLVFFLLFGFFCSSSCYSQTLVSGLKKKHYGKYSGVIPAYQFLEDTTRIQVDETPISIYVSADVVVQQIGAIKEEGEYVVLFKDKNYYVIEARFQDVNLVDRWMLNEKNKTISREGISPQPNTILKKGK